MDIEETAITNGNGHAYPSPKEVDAERSLTPVTFTNGPEKGTQVAKITDLSDDTTYLTLADTPESANPVLLHCEWSPRHNTRLATAGIDTLTRLWTVPSPPTEANGHVTVQAVRDLVEEDDTRSSVSFIAWTNNGDAIAVASDCDGNGKINVWSKEGTRIVQYNSPGCPPILCLRWNPSSTLLLAMTAMEPKGGSSWISIYAPPNQQAVPLELAAGFQPLDAVWIDEQEFVVCNGSRVTGFRIDNMRIEKIRDYGKKKANGPIKVVYDTHAKLLAAACEDGTLDVWEIGQHGGTQVEINAHKGAVTDLKWQPNPDYSKTELPTSFLVSSGVDGDIHVWSSRSQYTRPVHTMRMQAAVLALAFSPNGQFLAATTNSHILIWKMSDLSQPRARWVRGSEPGWQSPKTNGEMVDEYHHSLCWDSTGKRLAYGVNSMVSDNAP
jgi:WD40 repeat protein